jgi:tetratricopeptide (TPR) repeat protein
VQLRNQPTTPPNDTVMIRVQFVLWLSAALLAGGTLVMSGCQSASVSPLPPDLPPIQASDFSPALWPQVDAAYQQVLARPGDAESNGRFAMVLHAAAKYELGEVFYQRAIEQEPSFRWIYYLSQLQTLSGQKEAAIASLQRALALDPHYVAARLKLGRLLIDTGKPADALVVLEAVFESDPGNAVVEFEMGRALSALDKRAEAIPHLERACRKVPEFGAAHYALAVAYRDNGQLQLATTHFELYERHKEHRPLQGDPLESEFLAAVQGTQRDLDQAELALQQGDLKKAIALSETVLQKEPDNATVRAGLIGIHYKMGNFAAAEAQYQEAMRRKLNSADLHYNFGMALLVQQRAPDAERLFRLALEANPTHPEALTQFGLLREKAGDDATATESYRKALAGEPALRQANYLLGRQLVKSRQFEQGIAYLEKSIEPDDAQSPWFLRALAGAHAEAGNATVALEVAKRAQQKAMEHNDQRLLPLLQQDIIALSQRAGIQ